MLEIGAQLYNVRMYTQNERDLGRTLERIAKIGYRSVQLSAIGNIPARAVRALCDANGLKIVLTHNAEQQFLEGIDALIEDHQVYDCKYIGLGAMSEKYRTTDWIDHFAADFEGPAQKIRDAGMKFMYHNHAFEFMRLPDGMTIMERLFSRLPAELMGVTADTYWLQFAGMDVKKWLSENADRLPCVHLKDMTVSGFENRMAAVGKGNLDFAGILDIVKNNGVTEYALVEQDNCYGQSPFACLKESWDYLKKII